MSDVTYDDDFDWFVYDEELERGAKLLGEAKTPFDERRALIKWLKAVEAVVSDTYDAQFSEPARLLYSALEHLNAGTTPELFKAEVVDKPSFPAWQRARARAVLTVNELVRLGAGVEASVRAVARETGMKPSALSSLRKAVNAGSGQFGVRSAMKAERQKFTDMMSSAKFMGKLGVTQLHLLVYVLRGDRLIHTHLRRKAHRAG